MNNHLVTNSLIVTDVGMVPNKRNGQLYRKLLVYCSLVEIRKIFGGLNLPNPLIVGAQIEVLPRADVVEFYYVNPNGFGASSKILFGKSLCNINLPIGGVYGSFISSFTYLAGLGSLSVDEAVLVCLELTFC